MEGTYTIYSGTQKVGTVVVSTEGLYYRFDCRCQLEKKAICKIFVSCGDDRISLGTPVPEEGCFVLRTRQPKKRFGAGDVGFCVAFEGDSHEIFVAVQETEPFPYLKGINNAYMQIRGSIKGVVIPGSENMK